MRKRERSERAWIDVVRLGWKKCFALLCIMCGVTTACERGAHRDVRSVESHDRVPSAWYLTAPHAEEAREELVYSTTLLEAVQPRGGVVEQVQRQLTLQLAARNDAPQYDGRLARAAAMLLGHARRGEGPMAFGELEHAAQRVGFAGMLFAGAVGNWDDPESQAAILRVVSQIPSNHVINRYAVVVGRDSEVAVLLGNVELELNDLPRTVALGSALQVRGGMSDRYARGSVFVTRPDGAVHEYGMEGRTIAVDIECLSSGTYRIEILGTGAKGPVVLMNVPIRVGSAQLESRPVIPMRAEPATSPERAEARVFELLNAARQEAALAPLSIRPEYRAVALAHSLDMQQNDFMGHVSPSTGTVQERGTRAKLRFSKLGECLAANRTPEEVVTSLLDSPAHRAAILDPTFDTVGIGALLRPDSFGKPSLLVTLVLGRVPPPEATRLTEAEVLDALQELRKSNHLAPLRVDAILGKAAHAGGLAAVRASDSAIDERLALGVIAAVRELRRSARRGADSREVCFRLLEVLERKQLESAAPFMLDPVARAIGVGVAAIESPEGPRLSVFLSLQGKAGAPLNCK
jgi:uncharacterized protein YkwD